MYCRNCGALNKDGLNFCVQCGAPLNNNPAGVQGGKAGGSEMPAGMRPGSSSGNRAVNGAQQGQGGYGTRAQGGAGTGTQQGRGGQPLQHGGGNGQSYGGGSGQAAGGAGVPGSYANGGQGSYGAGAQGGTRAQGGAGTGTQQGRGGQPLQRGGGSGQSYGVGSGQAAGGSGVPGSCANDGQGSYGTGTGGGYGGADPYSGSLPPAKPVGGGINIKNPKIFLLLIPVVIVIILIVFIFTRKPKINVMDYVTVEFTGANGYGKAELSGQYEWRDEALDLIKKDKNAFRSYILGNDSLNDIKLEYDMDPADELSNGDTVVVSVIIDDVDEDLPFRLVGPDLKVKVEDLPEVRIIDLFEDIEISFSGYAPNASVSVTGECEYTYVRYRCDDTGFSNGDTITIYAEYDEDELLEAGYTAMSDEFRYTVTGLDGYISSLSDIDNDSLGKMRSQCEDVIQASAAKNWNSENEKLKGMEFLGCYLRVPKSVSGRSSYKNVVYLVYAVDAWNSKVGDFTYYAAFKFQDLMQLADGTISVDIDSCEMISNKYYPGDKYYYYGYGTLDSLFSACITSYLDTDSYESTVK